MTYEWREQLSVGNDLIDSDHKHLIELINQIQSSFGAMPPKALSSAIADLSNFLSVHCAREDKIARVACGEPLAQQIYEAHMALMFNLSQIQREISGTMSNSSIEQLNGFIGDLIVHLIKQELQMKPFLSKYSPSYAPL